jgi:predicted HD phosphohydrolase
MSSDDDPGVVSFTRMADGTAEDYRILQAHERRYLAGIADRVLAHMALLDGELGGYQVSRLEHCLQSATRAHRDGRDEEYVVCALLHDIGDVLAPYNHSEMAATMLAPFVSERNQWIVRHHGVFQGYYFFHHYGADREARNRYSGHPWYDATAEFCELYDQNCFDPTYGAEPLEFFAPLVRTVLAKPKHSIYAWHLPDAAA